MNLWGDDFVVESTQNKSKKLIEKINNPKQVKKPKQPKQTIEDRLALIEKNVNSILGKYAESTIVIKTKEEFNNYIEKCVDNGSVALDTETDNSLDPLTCKLMGLCLYSPGLPAAYIPTNHVERYTNKRLDWQLTEEDIKEGLSKLNDTKIITHNGKFDYKVIKCTCDFAFHIYWDTQIGAKILDENEFSAKLKEQYVMKIDPMEEKYSIEHLFDKLEYAIVDPDLFALYAATDAYKTYRLYEYQLTQLENPKNKSLLDVFMNIEMPIVTISAEMELTGVCLDIEYSKRLKLKYDKKISDIEDKLNAELLKYEKNINEWRASPEANFHPAKKKGEGFSKSKNEQLSDPPALSSPTQLAILLYDILRIKPVDRENPRGTGESILEKIDLPLCKLILEQRTLAKLANTYINKLPECLSPTDGRLHANFNQYGAKTGRFSSSEPNLQNIPSHENSIRMMFTASPNYVMIGADYSQQEPRLLAHYSQDENMIKAYREGKDLYATIASKVYHNNYEDNLEFNPITKQIQPDGKKRRTSVKSLLLGIMYGMSSASIANDLGVSIKEAEGIKQGFFKEFPKVERWINETIDFAHTNGYVTDVWGRRRRLPDIQLPKYEVKYKQGNINFNPLLYSSGVNSSFNQNKIDNYIQKLNKCKNRKEAEAIKEQARLEQLTVKDNTGFISQAERQCVNARIQGGAASMSKRAMIAVSRNEELKNLGFRLLIAVHDELIGECPEENKEVCKELLSNTMINSALPEVIVPMKCDASDFKSWYLDVYTAEIKKEYNNLKEKMSEAAALKQVIDNHIELESEKIVYILQNM